MTRQQTTPPVNAAQAAATATQPATAFWALVRKDRLAGTLAAARCVRCSKTPAY